MLLSKEVPSLGSELGRKLRVAAAVMLLLASPASGRRVSLTPAKKAIPKVTTCSPRQEEASRPSDANLFRPAAAKPVFTGRHPASNAHNLVWNAENGWYYEAPMKLPKSLQLYLKQRIATANQLLLPKNKITSIDLFASIARLNDSNEIDGNPGYPGNIQIILPRRRISWGEIGQAEDHEIEHVIDYQNLAKNYNMTGDHIGHESANPNFVKAFGLLRQNYDQAAKAFFSTQPQPLTTSQQTLRNNIEEYNADVSGSWFAAIDESTYDSHVNSVVGHPYADYNEAFASGAHVMQRYPHGVECSIRMLPPTGQYPIKLLLRSIIEIEQAQPNGPATVPKMFDPGLVEAVSH